MTTTIKSKPVTEFVTDHTFKLQFGWEEYPRPNLTRIPKHFKTYQYPKNQGGNGKISRFR